MLILLAQKIKGGMEKVVLTFNAHLTLIIMVHNVYALIQETSVCLGNISMGLVVFISLDLVLKLLHGMELIVYPIMLAHLDFMVLQLIVFLYLRDVYPPQLIRMGDA